VDVVAEADVVEVAATKLFGPDCMLHAIHLYTARFVRKKNGRQYSVVEQVYLILTTRLAS
jgi:hypothetical protein